MNAEFAKALLAAGPEIHAVGLVINVNERSSLNIQSMIGLLHELKIDLKHVVVIFTHGNTLQPQNFPTTMELGERCAMRCELLPKHIEELECLVRLLADVNNRFLVVENQQSSERDTIADQLFGCIDSIAADPMTNDTFRNSLQWWNEQQASRRRKENELRDAKDKLANLQAERAKKDLEKLRSEHRCLEDECSNLSSKLDMIREIKEMLVEMHQIGSETDQFTAGNAALKEELKRVEEEENVLHEQEGTLDALKGKVMQRFVGMVQNYTNACTHVISNQVEGITTLEKAANEVDKVMLGAIAAKVAGFGAGIVGGALFTLGTCLLLGGITAPAGIPLMGVGAVVSGAASVTALGGSIGQLVKKSMTIKQVKKWLQVNKTMCHELITAHKGLTEEHGHIVELFPCINAELPGGTNEVGEIVNMWIDIIAQQYSAGDAAELVLKTATSGLEVAGGVLESIDAGVDVAALGVNSAVSVSGGVAVGLSGLVIVIDLGFLIKSCYDLHRVLTGNRSNLSRSLMLLAKAVREDNNFLREVNNCTARLGSIDDPSSSVICNPSMGNEEQLPNSLEPEFTNEIECHTMGDGWDHDHSETESDTNNISSEHMARIDSVDTPQADTSDTRIGYKYCIVS